MKMMFKPRNSIITCMQIAILVLLMNKNYASAYTIYGGGSVQTNEVKSGMVFSLCGDTFVMAWKYMCKYKKRQMNNGVEKLRSKRSIERELLFPLCI